MTGPILLPRTVPYRPRHRYEDAARGHVDAVRDGAIRSARLLLRERLNELRRQDQR